ncbi:uncharacterized protein LOC122274521 [Carya illinoinensis]|uniref:uncharacterized protein LOC122274521 n=1 Tax=Carya illinoinensis TaxID=32201 RepID=UPI001C71F873|nr:uncharacterized protein LOC122274521 [Carya illinoinensis]
MNDKLLRAFPTVHMEYVDRKTSDHCLMIIQGSMTDDRYGPVPFRFLNMWTNHVSFQDCVAKVWREPVEGEGLWRLAAKLKKLKVVLRIWNKNIFGHVGNTILDLEGRVARLEVQLQGNYDPDVELDFLVTKAKLAFWEQNEEARLAQMAKKKWLDEGDQNSSFFHAVTTIRKRKAVISSMTLMDGRVLNSPDEVHLGAARHFQEFLSEGRVGVHVDMSDLISEEVSEEENQALCRRPLAKEVWEAIMSIPR